MIADYRDQIVQNNDLSHARQRFLRRTIIDVLDLAAEYRARRQRGELHAGKHVSMP